MLCIKYWKTHTELAMISFLEPSFSRRSMKSSNDIFGNSLWAQCSSLDISNFKSSACVFTNKQFQHVKGHSRSFNVTWNFLLIFYCLYHALFPRYHLLTKMQTNHVTLIMSPLGYFITVRCYSNVVQAVARVHLSVHPSCASVLWKWLNTSLQLAD